MKKKRVLYKKIISYITASALVFSSFSFVKNGAVSEVNADTLTDSLSNMYDPETKQLIFSSKKDERIRNVNICTDGYLSCIGNPTSTSETATEWMGTKFYAGEDVSGSAICWRVLRNDSDAILSLSDLVIDEGMFLESGYPWAARWNDLEYPATAQLNMDVKIKKYYKKAPDEGDVLAHLNCWDGKRHQYVFEPLYNRLGGGNGYYYFLMDAAEMENASLGFGSVASRIPSNLDNRSLMLRTSNETVGETLTQKDEDNLHGKGRKVVTIELDGSFGERGKTQCATEPNLLAIQQGIYLDKSDIWYMTPADYKKTTFGLVGDDKASTNEWKITTKPESTWTNEKIQVPNYVQVGKKLTFTIPDGIEGCDNSDYTQTSVMMMDADGKLVAYGKVGDAGSGTKTFTVPEDMPVGIYDMYIYFEEVNEDLHTDHAGAFYRCKINVNNQSSSITDEKVTSLETRRINLNHDNTISGISDAHASFYYGSVSKEKRPLLFNVIDAYTTGWSDCETIFATSNFTLPDESVYLVQSDRDNPAKYDESATKKYLNSRETNGFLENFSDLEYETIVESKRDWLFEDTYEPSTEWLHYDFYPLSSSKIFLPDRSELIRDSYHDLYNYVGEYRNNLIDAHIFNAAANFSLDRIFYTTSVENEMDMKTNSFGMLDRNHVTDTWKITLHDDDTSFNAKVLDTSGKRGTSIGVEVTSKGSGNYNMTTAMLEDSYGNVAAYGKISDELTGKMQVRIPDKLEPGTYTLHIFNEYRNDNYAAVDYASKEVTASITVTDEEPYVEEKEYFYPVNDYTYGNKNDVPDTSKHKYEWVVTRQPSDHEFAAISDLGERVYKCSDCGDIYITESIINTGNGLVYGVFSDAEALESLEYLSLNHMATRYEGQDNDGHTWKVDSPNRYCYTDAFKIDAIKIAVSNISQNKFTNMPSDAGVIQAGDTKEAITPRDIFESEWFWMSNARTIMDETVSYCTTSWFWWDGDGDGTNLMPSFSCILGNRTKFGKRTNKINFDYSSGLCCYGNKYSIEPNMCYSDEKDDYIFHNTSSLIAYSDEIELWEYRYGDETNYNPDGVAYENSKEIDLQKLVEENRHLSDLHISGAKLKNIEAIKELDSLKTLYIDNCNISDLSFLKGMKLEYLSINNNPITDISALKGMPLKALYMDNCNVSDISALEGMSLVYLSANNNKIKSLEAIKDTTVSILYMNNNEITSLNGIEKLPLTNIDLSNNKINDVSALANKKQVMDIKLNNNELENVNGIRGLENLTKLDLSYNKITDLSGLSGVNNLTTLDIRYNKVTDISCLLDCTKIYNLYVSNNELKSLHGIENMWLGSFSFAYNQVTSLQPVVEMINNSFAVGYTNSPYVSSPSFRDCIDEFYINGSHNKIRRINSLEHIDDPSNIIYSLDLSYNKIEDVSGLGSINIVENLDISNNRISDLTPLKDSKFVNGIKESFNKAMNPNMDDYLDKEFMAAFDKAMWVNNFCEKYKISQGNYITKDNAIKTFGEEICNTEEYIWIYDENGWIIGKDGNKSILKTGKTWLTTQEFLDNETPLPPDDEIDDGVDDYIPNQYDVLGDVDGDRKVTLKDAKVVLKAALGIERLTASQKKCADVNKDGTVNLLDAKSVLKVGLGIMKNF